MSLSQNVPFTITNNHFDVKLIMLESSLNFPDMFSVTLVMFLHMAVKIKSKLRLWKNWIKSFHSPKVLESVISKNTTNPLGHFPLRELVIGSIPLKRTLCPINEEHSGFS